MNDSGIWAAILVWWLIPILVLYRIAGALGRSDRHAAWGVLGWPGLVIGVIILPLSGRSAPLTGRTTRTTPTTFFSSPSAAAPRQAHFDFRTSNFLRPASIVNRRSTPLPRSVYSPDSPHLSSRCPDDQTAPTGAPASPISSSLPEDAVALVKMAAPDLGRGWTSRAASALRRLHPAAAPSSKT